MRQDTAFARAGEPKKLVELDGGHYDSFPGGPFHDRAVTFAGIQISSTE